MIKYLILLFTFLPLLAQGQIQIDVDWAPQRWAFSPGEAITFQATNKSGQESLTYAWTFSDGAQYEGDSVQHGFAAPGWYSLYVLGQANDGSLSIPFFAMFFINPVFGSSATHVAIESLISDQSVVPAGSMLQFDATSEEDVAEFVWQILGTELIQTGPHFDLEIPADIDNLSITVAVFAVNTTGFTTPKPATRSIYIYKDNQPPQTRIIDPSFNDGVIRIQQGTTLSFTAQGTDPDGHTPLSYAWRLGSEPNLQWYTGATVELSADIAGEFPLFAYAIDAQER